VPHPFFIQLAAANSYSVGSLKPIPNLVITFHEKQPRRNVCWSRPSVCLSFATFPHY